MAKILIQSDETYYPGDEGLALLRERINATVGGSVQIDWERGDTWSGRLQSEMDGNTSDPNYMRTYCAYQRVCTILDMWADVREITDMLRSLLEKEGK